VPNEKGGLSSYRGHFLDVIGAAFAFDGEDSSDLDEHLKLWGMEPVDATCTASVDPESAETMVSLAISIHRLAMAIDSEVARWV
jgi:hypothetical protein